MIEKNTTITAKKSEIFSTAEDNQPAVTIHVIQGEREMASGNKTLGRFELMDIPPAPRGTPQVEVTFDIDVNGIVEVSVKEKMTGKSQSIRITHSSGLSQEEIDRLIRDAEAHAEEDNKKKELVNARNSADALIYSMEKTLKDLDGKIDSATKIEVEDAVRRLKQAMERNDISEIKQQTEVLTQASHKMAQSVYQQTGPSGTYRQPENHHSYGERSNSNEEVVDAEYEEVA